MKKFASLVLFFSLCFVLILFLSVIIGLLEGWTQTAVMFPALDAAGRLADSARGALPHAFYFSLLFGLNYSFRRQIIYPAAFITMLVLSVGLCIAASIGLSRLEPMRISFERPVKGNAAPIEEKSGLILPGNNGSQTVFLVPDRAAGSIVPGTVLFGSSVIAPPSLDIYYQADSAIYRSPPARLPFRNETNPLLSGIAGDFAHSASYLEAWFNNGFLAFAIYAGSLAALLLSLGCLVNISFWSLANLFFGILAFRGALAMETFLNTTDIHLLLSSFAGNIIPESLINPVIFCLLAFLILLYSGLVYLARGRRVNG